MTSRIAAGMLLVLATGLGGCSPQRKYAEPILKTFPVTGVVQVDGEPTAGLRIMFVPEAGTTELTRITEAITVKDGKFTVSTYQAGDGLPAGKYLATFEWREPGIRKPDKLKGAYSDPAKSKIAVTVKAGAANDLGVIDISTKPAGK